LARDNDLVDQVISVNEAHLKRLLSQYVRHYREDRTHLGLNKQTPAKRVYSAASGRVLVFSRLGCITATNARPSHQTASPPKPCLGDRHRFISHRGFFNAAPSFRYRTESLAAPPNTDSAYTDIGGYFGHRGGDASDT